MGVLNLSDIDNAYEGARARIFELLKKRKISQKEFAAKINVTPQTITDWKKGKSSSFLSMLGKISVALETTPIWLFSGEGKDYMSDEEHHEHAERSLEDAYRHQALHIEKILAGTKASEREKEFVQLFQKLTPEQQDMILAQLKGVVDSQGN